MAITLYAPDGTPVQVDDMAQASKLAATGELRFDANATYNVVDRATGEVYQANGASVASGLSDRFQLEDPSIEQARIEKEQFGTVGQQALTFAENAADEATFGISAAASDRLLGEEYQQARLARERVNPGIATAGHVAGFVAPMVATGGGSGLLKGGASAAKGAAALTELGQAGRAMGVMESLGAAGGRATKTALQATPAGLTQAAGNVAERQIIKGLERLGLSGSTVLGAAAKQGIATAGAGAVEGAIEGGVRAVSETLIAPDGDMDGAAQRILSGMASGAGWGTVFGGTLGGTFGGAGKLISNKLGNASEAAKDVAAVHFAKAMGAKASDTKALGEDGMRRIYRQLMDETVDGKKVVDWLDRPADIAPKMEALRQKVGTEYGEALTKLDTYIEKQAAHLRPNLRGFFDGLDNKIQEAREAGITDTVSRLERASQNFQQIREKAQGPEGISFGELWEFRKKLDAETKLYKATGSGRMMLADPNKETLIELRNELEEALTASADNAAAEIASKDPTNALGTSYSALKAKYAAAKTAADLSANASAHNAGTHMFGLMDRLEAGAGQMVAAGTMVNAAIQGGVDLATLATGGVAGLAISGGMKVLSKLARERGSSVIAQAAHAIAKNDETVMRKAQEIAALGKVAARRTTVHGAMSLREIEQRKREERQQRAANAAKLREVLGAKKKDTMGDAYRRQLTKTHEALGLAERELSQVNPEAPTLAAAMARQQARAASYLIEKAPVGLGASIDPLQPHLKQAQVEPDPVALQSYAHRLEVVRNPQVVFDRIKDGTLTPEHVEALKTVYPAQVPVMQNALVQAMRESKERVPYETRMSLGLLLEVPTTYDLEPTALATIQAGFAAPPAPPEVGGSVRPMSAGSAEVIASYQTPIGGALT